LKAIILSAGQGSRLLPLTATSPKCLIDFSGRPLLEWQLRSLAQAGVREAAVVTGFAAEQVEHALEGLSGLGMKLRTVFNPFYALADNLASCWMARGEMMGDFLILNGDTLIEPGVAARVVEGAPTAPITVTIDRKADYDADDMKVHTEGDRLLAIGKTLTADVVNGESIGFLRFSPEGGAAFVAEIDRAVHTEVGLKRWYLSAVDHIAKTEGIVGVRSIEGLDWGELDFPADLERNRAMTAAWAKG